MPLISGMVPTSGTLCTVPLASDIAKRNILGTDDRIGSSRMVQPLACPLSNHMMLPQAVKTGDGTNAVDSLNVGESAALGGKVFSTSLVPGMQWRPGNSFQNQAEPVCGSLLIYVFEL
uniref:CCR4-NOT transcription complex subunit 3 isoform X3 n=1 Tax=Rhizophora mucronata TaxID=61149 RepID=A0A2P2IZ36_RHIMU